MIAKVLPDGTKQYFLSDWLRACITIDGSGNIIGRQSHLPFGEELGTGGLRSRIRPSMPAAHPGMRPQQNSHPQC